MNRILLTSTALVMVAGIAAADGHASMSWSANATAGVARAGSGPATALVAAAATAVSNSAYFKAFAPFAKSQHRIIRFVLTTKF